MAATSFDVLCRENHSPASRTFRKYSDGASHDEQEHDREDRVHPLRVSSLPTVPVSTPQARLGRLFDTVQCVQRFNLSQLDGRSLSMSSGNTSSLMSVAEFSMDTAIIPTYRSSAHSNSNPPSFGSSIHSNCSSCSLMSSAVRIRHILRQTYLEHDPRLFSFQPINPSRTMRFNAATEKVPTPDSSGPGHVDIDLRAVPRQDTNMPVDSTTGDDCITADDISECGTRAQKRRSITASYDFIDDFTSCGDYAHKSGHNQISTSFAKKETSSKRRLSLWSRFKSWLVPSRPRARRLLSSRKCHSQPPSNPEVHDQENCQHRTRGSTKHMTVKEVRESEIPYISSQTTSGRIAEDGAELLAGGVQAKLPPASLPLHSLVSMMVLEIEQGFRYDGKVAFSPQVFIGPHCNCCLGSPAKLSIPLEMVEDGQVTVLVSKTAAGISPDWEVVPPGNVTVKDTSVEVETIYNCVYQAQSGPRDFIIKPQMEQVFFSVSCKRLPDQCTLLLRCSGNANFCTQSRGQYELCHPPEETLAIRAVCGDFLSMSVTCKKNSITQLSTPFDIDQELECPLDEQFSIAVGSPLERRRRRSVWSMLRALFPARRHHRQQHRPTATQREEKDFCFYWDIEPSDCDEKLPSGVGLLKVQSYLLSPLEGADQEEAESDCDKCHMPRDVTGVAGTLTFRVQWQEESQFAATSSRQEPHRSRNDTKPETVAQREADAPHSADIFPLSPFIAGKDHRLYERVMFEVADHFVKMYDCKKLAVHLDLAHGSNVVDSLIEANQRMTASEVAFIVMKTCLFEKGYYVFGELLPEFLQSVLGWKSIAEYVVKILHPVIESWV